MCLLPRSFKSHAVIAVLATSFALLSASRANAMPMAATASTTDVQAYSSATPMPSTLLGDATAAAGAFSGNDVMGPSNDPLASQLDGASSRVIRIGIF